MKVVANGKWKGVNGLFQTIMYTTIISLIWSKTTKTQPLTRQTIEAGIYGYTNEVVDAFKDNGVEIPNGSEEIAG